MSLPILSASNPTTVPAVVYDKWWVQRIDISAPNPNGDAYAQVTLVKFATGPDGNAITSNEVVFMNVDNLLSNAATDPELGGIIIGLMNYIMKVGQNQGIIANNDDQSPSPDSV
jgi:hypothetical protein